MHPLFQDPQYTFHFAEARIIPRFHLQGIEEGRPVTVVRIDPVSGMRLEVLARAAVGFEGWVDLPQPILMRAGEGFIAIPG